jgi:hypothetical protein
MVEEGGIYPTFFCHVPGNDACGVIPCIWNSPLQKRYVVEKVKAKFKQLKIERYAFYGESWQTNREGLAPDEATPPERLADTQEVIFVYAEDRNGLSKAGWWPISDVAGQVTLGDFVVKEIGPSSAGNMFADMFGIAIFH